MRRFFLPASNIRGDEAKLTGQDARHVKDVLRLGPGDELYLLDGTGKEYRAIIVTILPGEVSCKILEECRRDTEPRTLITLVQGLPKGDKMDFVVQKATELGASRIIPTVTERSIPRPDPERATGRVERWRRIAKESAEQSGRAVIPEVSGILPFDAAFSLLPCGTLLILPWEVETSRGLAEALSGADEAREVAVFIGPEGGFSRDEVELARKHGAVTVTLGPRILRTETAGLVVLTIILYERGELG